MERFKRLADGPDSFAVDQVIEQVEKEFPTVYDQAMDDIIHGLGFERYSTIASRLRSNLALCNLHLSNLKKREACEIVLWGNALPDTLDEIEFFEQEKQCEIKEASQEKA